MTRLIAHFALVSAGYGLLFTLALAFEAWLRRQP